MADQKKDQISPSAMRRFIINPIVWGSTVAAGAVAVNSALSEIKKEKIQNEPFTDPKEGGQNFDASVQATQTAVSEKGWDQMIKEGFPKLAVDSAAKILVSNNEVTSIGSASLMHYVSINGNEYLVAITCGHLFDDVSKPQRIEIKRTGSIPNNLDINVHKNQFAFRYLYDGVWGGKDYGIAVTKIDNEIRLKLPPVDCLVHLDDLDFEKKNLFELNKLYGYGVGYQGDSRGQETTEPQTTVRARLKICENMDMPIFGYVTLDDTRILSGGSGEGIFVTQSDNNKPIFFGINILGPSFLDPTIASSGNKDMSVVFPVCLIGKGNFTNIIEQCIVDLG